MKTSEIELTVSELKQVLPGFAKVISRRTTLPILGCVKLAQDATGVITLQANNLDEIITVRLQSQGKPCAGEMLLVFDEISKLIKSCGAADCVRFCATKEETSVRFPVAGNLITRPLTHLDPKEWPASNDITEEAFELDDTFKQVLRQALECASEDTSRYVLQGAFIDVRDKECHYVVGTDGKSLFSANSFKFQLPEELIVPSRKFLTWPGFVNDGAWTIRMRPAVKVDPTKEKADKEKEEPAWFQIRSRHWSYLTRAIDGQYPNWKQVIPTDIGDWTCVIITPESARLIQQAIALLPGADVTNETVVLEISPGGFYLRGRGQGEVKDTRMHVPDVPVSGKAVEVALNRQYLLRGLNFGLDELRICDSLSPVVFRTSNRTMVIMPVRFEGAPTPSNPAPVQSAPTSEPVPISPQQENAAVATPSAATVDNTTAPNGEPTMSTATTTETNRLNGRVNGNGSNQSEELDNRTSFKAALDQIEQIKTTLREVIVELSGAVSLLKAADKARRTTSKEIDAVRSKLREIQSVKL